jgi:hypothetical protein
MQQAMRYLGVRNEEAMIATKKAVQMGAGLNSMIFEMRHNTW